MEEEIREVQYMIMVECLQEHQMEDLRIMPPTEEQRMAEWIIRPPIQEHEIVQRWIQMNPIILDLAGQNQILIRIHVLIIVATIVTLEAEILQVQ